VVNTIDKRDSLTVSYTLANMSSDNTNNNMMPLYSVRGSGPYYRNMQSHPYERLDAKPTYGTVWLAPCEEDTSPTENYSFDQSASYMPTPPQPAGSNTYSLPYRSTQPTVRTHTAAANYYSDYGQPYTTNGLPYLQTDLRSDAHIGPISPLNFPSRHVDNSQLLNESQGTVYTMLLINNKTNACDPLKRLLHRLSVMQHQHILMQDPTPSLHNLGWLQIAILLLQ
jgi:hypothetical protein